MKITDKAIYENIHWTIESEEETYFVQCQEYEFHESWHISSDMDDDIDPNSELGKKLISICCDNYENDPS